MPILNFLGLLAAMTESYWVLPERVVGGHVVSGFASKGDDAIGVLLYAHNGHDIQSRSKTAFEITLDLSAVPWPKVRVRQYRFDQENNSYYRLGIELRDRLPLGPKMPPPGPDQVQKLIADLQSSDRAVQIDAAKKAASFSKLPEEVTGVAFKIYMETKHKEVRTALEEAMRQIKVRQECYSPQELAQVRQLSLLRVTKESIHAAGANGALPLAVAIAANGANFVVIEPVENSY